MTLLDRTRRLFQNLPQRWAFVRTRLQRRDARVTCDRAGVRIVVDHVLRGKETVAFAWNDVVRAVLYRRDLVVYDLLCIEFQLAERMYLVDDAMTGWDDLVAGLQSFVPRARRWPDVLDALDDEEQVEIFRQGS